MSVYQWSTAAAGNDLSDPAINWQEGQNPNTVNNSARAMMAAIAAFVKQINGSTQSSGAANAQSFASPPGFSFTSYVTGMMITFRAGLTNTAACTLNVDLLGARSVKKRGSSDLVAGDIVAGNIITVIYDGASFQIVSSFADADLQNVLNSAALKPIISLAPAADTIGYYTGPAGAALTGLSAFGRSLIDDASSTAARTTLGLGSIATQNASSVAITGGSVSAINDLSVADGGTGSSTSTGARSNLGIGTMGTRQYNASTSAPSGGADGDVWFRYV